MYRVLFCLLTLVKGTIAQMEGRYTMASFCLYAIDFDLRSELSNHLLFSPRISPPRNFRHSLRETIFPSTIPLYEEERGESCWSLADQISLDEFLDRAQRRRRRRRRKRRNGSVMHCFIVFATRSKTSLENLRTVSQQLNRKGELPFIRRKGGGLPRCWKGF